MKKLCILLLTFLLPYNVYSQCECTDCSIFVPSNTTQSSFLDISGAANSTLGQNGQQVCQVCIELVHDAIEEFDIFLIAPDGSEVQLMEDSGLSINDDITFEICFVSCDQSADPDSGFPAVFDTGAGWVPGASYDGTYYPAIGCLEDLSGPVNGEWELEMTDNVGGDDGTLFDWHLVFTDDTGVNCANGDQCDISVSCISEGGELTSESLVFCEGDPGLQIDESPDFPNGNEPPSSEYTYTFVIVNTDTDIIEEINENTDLTAYVPGNYQICGLSYSNEDESDIPNADGSLTIADIQDDIDNEVYCADLSDNCFSVTIEETPEAPDFVGPLTACPDELVVYEILNYDPDESYFYTIDGSFAGFIESSPGVVEITWLSGPTELCAVLESSCGNISTCVETEIIDSPEIEIIGELSPCPGSIQTYEFQPTPSGSESYVFTISGGTIINQTINSVEIEWPNLEDEYELCAELVGGECTFEPFCTDIDVSLDFELPSTLDSPDELCNFDIGTSSISNDPNIISYNWTSSNLNIISGEGTSSVDYEGVNFGAAEICLEIETNCGIQGPVCETIDILEQPEPEILDITPSCDFIFTLESNADPNNDIEWTQEAGPGTANISDDDQVTTEVEVFTAGEYTFEITETNGICESTAFVVVEILAELEVSDPIFECNLDNEYNVTFEILSGDAPFTVNGDLISGTTFTSEFIPSDEEFEFTVIDNIGCNAAFEVQYECPCISDAGTMFNNTLFLCIEEEDFFEADFDDNALLDNNDIGIFYLHDGDDDELGEVFDISLTGEFEYQEDYLLGVPYYISYVVGNEVSNDVDLDDECLSVAEGQEVIFLGATPVSLDFDEVVCGNSILIYGMLGEEIVDIQWTQVDGPGVSEFLNDENIPTEITVNQSGSYTFEIEIENEACIYYQEIDIEFSNGPNIENISESCDGAGNTYQVNFEISGNAPFTSSDGIIDNNGIFISSNFSTGEAYEITISDNNGCTQVVTGNKLCDCLSDAGQLIGQNESICLDDTINVTINNPNLDSDDNGIFILHDGTINNIGNILNFNTTGEFIFTNNLQADSIYFINYIVGNALLDSVDLNDVCLDVSNAFEVSWLAYAVVDAGENQASCTNVFSLNASPENGSWRIIDAPLNSIAQFEDFTQFNTNFEADLPGQYILEWSSANGQCISSDQILVEIYPEPVVTNETTFCLDNLEEYVLSFDITGTNGPYTVNGTLLTDDEFASGFLTTNEVSSFEIISGDGCITNFEFGPVDCSCDSEIGTFLSPVFELCDFESLDPNISNGDFIAQVGQELSYVLHDGDADVIGNILATSQGEAITFDNTLIAGQTYFLTPVLSTLINGEVDFSDVCLQISQGIPVIWNDSYEINLIEIREICQGDNLSIELIIEGEYPIQLNFENTIGENFFFEITELNSVLEFGPILESTSISLTNAQGECLNAFNGDFEIQVMSEPEVNLTQGLEICNNEDFGSTIAITDLIDQSIDGIWDTGSIPLINDVLDFDNLSAGSYIISFSTVGFYEPCTGDVYTTEILVNDCDCPIFNNPDIELCTNQTIINLNNFDIGTYEGDWAIQSLEGQNTSPIISNGQVYISNAEAGAYQIQFIIDDPSLPNNCNNIVQINLIIEQAISAGLALEPISLCIDEASDISLSELIENADPNGSWFFENQEVPNIIQSSILTPGENIFQYILPDGNLCPGDQIENIIILNEAPEFSINSENILCFGNDDGEIEIIIEDQNGTSVNCYLNDILQDDGKLITNLSLGTYQIYVENEFCTSQLQQVEIVEPEPIFVTLGDDREIEVGEEISILAITNILDSDIEDISWTNLAEILQVDLLELRSTFEENSTIQVEITDSNGCVALDQIQIRIIAEDIYIPNVMNISDNTENAIFKVQNLNSGIQLVESLLIFDRWGNKVHELENISPDNFGNITWDGYFNNQPAEQGVYVYSLILTDTSGARRIYAGDITLIR